MSEWTFITNHGAVLALVAEHEQITARDIAVRLRITERSVRRIIVDLEGSGYLQRYLDGRVNWYRVRSDLPLRREVTQGVAVGKLLRVLADSPLTLDGPGESSRV
ncbi:MAG: HTH domain-containing protein [Dehalococcoidia bacterium]